jgi:competence protein ComEC
LVYDAGPSFRSGSDTGQLVVAPYLKSRGLRVLDRLAVSHDDDDHKGGAVSVLALMPTRSLTLGPSLTQSFAPEATTVGRDRCERGHGWTWDDVEFRWLHPGTREFARDNDSSCMLLVRAGNRTALITGDVEAEAERELVAAGILPRVDVVVVPHHGSRTSSTPDFVQAVSPRWAVYAVGHRNRWNFPVPRVVERWEQVGAEGVLTSRSGAVTFELVPGQAVAEPIAWRHVARRPWRDP